MRTPKIRGRRDQKEPQNKALERLHQFEEERGLPPTGPAGTPTEAPKANGRKSAPVKRRRR